ncbi:MAG: hypothetical protein LBT97_03195 [Planctomycetota bacterium]|jgi:hypothetical protein|nr:hypothetical protein [Planctomycetota bacterium]
MNDVGKLASVYVAHAVNAIYRAVDGITCAKSFHDVHCEVEGPVGVEYQSVKRAIMNAVRDGGRHG